MQILRQLDSLVPTLQRDVALARQLQSPNSEDELAIRVAIVGFSYHASIEQWSVDHYKFLKGRIDPEFALENLADYQPISQNIRLFAALCFGYLLGLYQTYKVTGQELQVLEAQIPGLIALRSNKLMQP
jgi:hypothetical protein